MNLLVFTQKVDLNDTVLSFFHRWIIELVKRFEKVTVVCLYEGEHELPANVKVFSLGKEKIVDSQLNNEKSKLSDGNLKSNIENSKINILRKIKYILRFYRLIWRKRRDYDAVFVHMNQEYILLGGIFWKLLGKKIYMWRNHYAGSFLTDLAALFCAKVFCTSKYSYTSKYSKTVIMPVGIDTEVFDRDDTLVDAISVPRKITRHSNSILSLGRIAPSKKLHQLIEALGILKKEHIDFSASIVGDALPRDREYLDSLKKLANDLNINEQVKFISGVPNNQAPVIYSAHEIFVNQSPSGMYDKTIFEAMACGTLCISCNKNLINKIDADFLYTEDDVDELAAKISKLLRFSTEEKNARGQTLRNFVEENHGLSYLGSRLAEELDNKS